MHAAAFRVGAHPHPHAGGRGDGHAAGARNWPPGITPRKVPAVPLGCGLHPSEAAASRSATARRGLAGGASWQGRGPPARI
jgi:hypothetical protein